MRVSNDRLSTSATILGVFVNNFVSTYCYFLILYLFFSFINSSNTNFDLLNEFNPLFMNIHFWNFCLSMLQVSSLTLLVTMKEKLSKFVLPLSMFFFLLHCEQMQLFKALSTSFKSVYLNFISSRRKKEFIYSTLIVSQ